MQIVIIINIILLTDDFYIIYKRERERDVICLILVKLSKTNNEIKNNDKNAIDAQNENIWGNERTSLFHSIQYSELILCFHSLQIHTHYKHYFWMDST